MGAASPGDLLRKVSKFSIKGAKLEAIQTPILVMEAEEDHFLQNQARKLFDMLGSSKADFVMLNKAEGAGQHCHMGCMARQDQVMYDWLAGKLEHNHASQ